MIVLILFIAQRLPDGSGYHAEGLVQGLYRRSSSGQQGLKLIDELVVTAPKKLKVLREKL
jgi:hypothetical protein